MYVQDMSDVDCVIVVAQMEPHVAMGTCGVP